MDRTKDYPEDDEFLVERETTVSHVHVAPPQELPG